MNKNIVEILARAERDALTGEKFAVAFIDCDESHGSIGLFATTTGYIIVVDSPVYEEDAEFHELRAAMRYYRRAKERVIHAVEAWAKIING